MEKKRKTQQENERLSRAPLGDTKRKKTQDLTGGGNSDYIAHYSIITVFTVCQKTTPIPIPLQRFSN